MNSINANNNSIEWLISDNPVDYDLALKSMESHVMNMLDYKATNKIWLLEHEDIYTIGVSGKEHDLINPTNIQIRQTNRGGKITYHGPGMRIIYVMLNLKYTAGGCDIRKFIKNLEYWVINSLKQINIEAFIREDRVGIWVKNGNKEEKIAAIGIRMRKWISFHGIAVNINPDLTKFNNIIPCGINDKKYGVTSINKLGKSITKEKFDVILKEEFYKIFSDFSVNNIC